MPKLRALTVRQPYAELIVSGRKAVETRSWPTALTGPLAIHAALDTFDDAPAVAADFGVELDACERGGVVGVVELVACRPSTDLSHVSTKGWGWKAEGGALVIGTDERRAGNVHAGWLWLLRAPQRVALMPIRGNVGIWELPVTLAQLHARR